MQYIQFSNFGIYTTDGNMSRLNFWYCPQKENVGTTEFQNVKIVPPIQPFHWLQYNLIYTCLRVLNFFRVYKRFKF